MPGQRGEGIGIGTREKGEVRGETGIWSDVGRSGGRVRGQIVIAVKLTGLCMYICKCSLFIAHSEKLGERRVRVKVKRT